MLRDYRCDKCNMLFEVTESLNESKNGKTCLDLCDGKLKQEISAVKGFMIEKNRWNPQDGLSPSEWARRN